MTKHTQCAKLLKALTRKRGVTSLEAAQDLFITSLHRRLADLRQMGVVIQAKAAGSSTGARFKRYHATSVPAHLLPQARQSGSDSFMQDLAAIVRNVSRKARG